MIPHVSRTQENVRIRIKHWIIIIYDETGIVKQEKEITFHCILT